MKNILKNPKIIVVSVLALIFIIVLFVAYYIAGENSVYWITDNIAYAISIILLILIYLQPGRGITISDTQASNISIYTENVFASEHLKKMEETLDIKYIELLYYLEKSKKRIENHIETLKLNGSFNLAIGIVATSVGMIILYNYLKDFDNSVLNLTINLKTPTEIQSFTIIKNVQRIALIVLVELFSFFFLRLYRTSSQEVKYFQNEITNIDLKAIGIRLSMINPKDEVFAKMVDDFVKNERNFILQDKQSTVALEGLKLASKEDKNLIDNLKELISVLKNKKESN